MATKIIKEKKDYHHLIKAVGQLLEEARRKVYREVNSILVDTYWEIGRRIVEFEQQGKEKAEYGSQLLDKLCKDLKEHYGKGFSRSNLYLMRLFYLKYPKIQTASGKLSWNSICASLFLPKILKKLDVISPIGLATPLQNCNITLSSNGWL